MDKRDWHFVTDNDLHNAVEYRPSRRQGMPASRAQEGTVLKPFLATIHGVDSSIPAGMTSTGATRTSNRFFVFIPLLIACFHHYSVFISHFLWRPGFFEAPVLRPRSKEGRGNTRTRKKFPASMHMSPAI